MKHNTKITLILITMFLLTQLIGLFIISVYANELELPYGFQNSGIESQSVASGISSIIFAFIIALLLFIFLSKFNAETFIRIWFLIVISLALGLTFTAIFHKLNIINYTSYIALIIAIPLAYIKIFKRNLIVHNITELLIYPGVGAIFVFLMLELFAEKVIWGITILLLIISLYDIWAVWKSEVMQKMAKYQINNLKFFTGFFIPYASKKDRDKIKQIKQKYLLKGEKFLERKLEKSKIKVNLAILGGGDIIFPIITAGIFYQVYNSILPALIIILFSTIALLALFTLARKGKFYPAMPFITTGLYLGMFINYLLF